MHDLSPYLRPLPPAFPSRISPLRSPPAVLSAIRELVERTNLPCAAIGARVGVSAATVSRWRRREGWVRPAAEEGAGPDPSVPSVAPPTNPRFRRGRGRRYVPDVVERVRVLVEGTALTNAAIASKTGVAVTTVFNWTRRRGWTRPAGAERWKPLVAAERAGLGPQLRAGFGRVEVLARRELERLAGEKRRIEDAIGAAERLAGTARRQAQLHGHDPANAPRLRVVTDYDGGPIRLSTREPRGRPGAARPQNLVTVARDLFERTDLPQAEVARRVRVSKATLNHWVQEGGWIRPVEAPSPFGGQRLTRNWRDRMAGRVEARRRLSEADGLLLALEADEKAEFSRIVAAFACLGDAVARSATRPPIRISAARERAATRCRDREGARGAPSTALRAPPLPGCAEEDPALTSPA